MTLAWTERLLAVNPFTDNRVRALSDAGAALDVSTVHQAAFERLTALAREAHTERRGYGAVLLGEAGIGKSHLLARLARWAGQGTNAHFVYLHNLQADPDNLARSLLRAVVSVLTWGRRRDFYSTPLYRLLLATVSTAIHEAGIERPPVTLREAERAYEAWVERQGRDEPALLDRTVYDVLFRLFRSSHRKLRANPEAAAAAVRWLGGDYLDPPDAGRLGLPPGPAPAALTDGQQIKQVFVALGHMALCAGRPLVLCFDQVDNLDDAQAAALFRFLEAVLDSVPDLLVVTAGIQATLLHWQDARVIQSSAWDRIGQFEIALQRVSPVEARAIVAARIREALEPVLTEEPMPARLAEDPTFPLGRAWLDAYLANRPDVRPRSLLSDAREAWRRMQEKGLDAWLADRKPEPKRTETIVTSEQLERAIDERVAEKLAEVRTERLAEPFTLPPDAAQLAGVVTTLLRQCQRAGPQYGLLGVQPQNDRPGEPGIRVELAPREGFSRGRRGRLLFLTTDSATSAATALRRVLREESRGATVWLITEERQPLRLAAKGKEYLRQLEQRGPKQFRRCELLLEDVVALHALQQVIGAARSGDLEIELPGGERRPLKEEEVIASHHRQGRYRTAPILRELLGEVDERVHAS